MTEVWADIPGLEGRYQASTEGRIKSLSQVVRQKPKGKWTTRVIPEKILKGTACRHGYRSVELQVDGKRKRFLVHRLVALTFIPNPSQKPHVNHIDCVTDHNRPGNLEWVTHAENMAHAARLNRMKANSGPGTQSPAAKLTDTDVVEIKTSLQRGESCTAIAERYPVSASCIREIKAGRSWTHINL